MQRPTGVTIIAILALIGGIFALCGGTVGVVGSGLGGLGNLLGFSHVRAGALFGSSFISLVLGVLNVVFGVGALQLKDWAWKLGVGIQLITLVDKGIDVIQGHGRVIASLSVLVAVLILAYLFSEPVRRAFGLPVTGQPRQNIPSPGV